MIAPRSRAALSVALALAAGWLAVLAGLAVPGARARHAPAAGTLVRVGDGTTATFTVSPGGLVTVPVEVVDAAGLGAATVVLSFDPAVVRAAACAAAVDPVFGGACNPGYAPNAVRFNVLADVGSAPNGVDGTHRLVEITFNGLANTGRSTALTLTVETFADPQGTPLPFTTGNGQILIGAGGPPDAVLRVGDAIQSTFVLTPGAAVSVPVTLDVTGTHALGSATLFLHYDPRAVRPTACLRAESTMGYCNIGFDPAAGLVKLNLLSSAGLTGTVRPYTLTFEVAAAFEPGTSALQLSAETFDDIRGDPLAWQAVDGSIDVSEGDYPSARVLVGPPGSTGTYTVAHGTTVSVSVWVTQAVHLGAASFALGYDSAVARAVRCAVVRNPDTGVDGGACNLLDDAVRASVIAPGGLVTTARLLEVAFTPAVLAAPGVTTALTLAVDNFADSAGVPMPARVVPGGLAIAPGGVTVAVVRATDALSQAQVSLPQDDRATVLLRVENAAGLSAASLGLAYDPAVVRPVSCTLGTPAFGGACNLAGEGVARLSLVAQAPFTGSATLAALAFQPATDVPVGARTGLTPTVDNFAGPAAEPLLYQTLTATLEITGLLGAAPVVLHAGRGVSRITPGQPVTVPISATVDAARVSRGLAAATLVLSYDPALMQPVTCTLQVGAGAPSGGFCNTGYAPGQVRFNALWTPGVTGSVPIAEIRFRAAGELGTVTTPTLRVDHLADSAATALIYRVELSSTMVVDVILDGVIDAVDAWAVAARWHRPPAYDPAYDVLPDGKISAADVQKVFACYGRRYPPPP